MRKLKTILQYRYTFKILTLVVIILEVIFLLIDNPTSKYTKEDNIITGTIKSYKIDGNKLTIELYGKEKIIGNYYIETEEDKLYYENNLNINDKLKLIVTLEDVSKNTIPNIFNYKKYLNNKKIFYIMNIDDIEIISKNNNLLYHIKNLIIRRINKIDTTGYLKLFILGDNNDIDEDIISTYQTNGIINLFSISGIHITILTTIILYILDKITYNKYLKYILCNLLLLFYLFISKSNPSILRATIIFILISINRLFNLKISSIDIFLLSLIIILIINPYIIYNIGFEFSYTITFFIILKKNTIKKIKNLFLKNLYISYLCFIVSIPICINNFYQINVLSILLNILLSSIVSIILYPICLLVLIIPNLNFIVVFITNIIENINLYISNIDIFILVLSKPNILIIILYYILIILIIYKPKYIYLLIIILLIHKNINYLNNNLEITYLDVQEGDSILIKFPNNKSNILIDTSGYYNYNTSSWSIRKKEYSISKSKIIPYLKSKGISKLDYLILTHGDYDHMGDSINLINNFKVEKVILNCGEYNELENELIIFLDKKNIKYYTCIKELNVDKYKLQFLNTDIYDNENDNSSVIYFNYNNYKFLFMGDASIEREKDILDKYKLENIDFLKVGHHGSDTSSSEYFIDSINPLYSIISVGINNRYGHPKDSVLDILAENGSKIYRTDEDGSIEIKIKSDGYSIKTCEP